MGRGQVNQSNLLALIKPGKIMKNTHLGEFFMCAEIFFNRLTGRGIFLSNSPDQVLWHLRGNIAGDPLDVFLNNDRHPPRVTQAQQSLHCIVGQNNTTISGLRGS